ncbi:MAG: GNAT family N-acetyltransferase [Spirochaetales bacterium]|nr:GNAT family N-acetyltransferase [Spirochaetales bacterium]
MNKTEKNELYYGLKLAIPMLFYIIALMSPLFLRRFVQVSNSDYLSTTLKLAILLIGTLYLIPVKIGVPEKAAGFENLKKIGLIKSGMCRNEDKLEAYELWGLYVEPLMKRQGIGSQLLRHCENIALENGCRENVLWVLEDNSSTRLFYKAQGYVADGSEKIMEKFNAKVIRYCKVLIGNGLKS